MNQLTLDQMLAELQEEKNAIYANIATAQEAIKEAQQNIKEKEQTIKEAEQELLKLENGIQFMKVKFLHEKLMNETEPMVLTSPPVEVKTKRASQLDAAILAILDTHIGVRMTAREVTDVLLQNHYPTTSKGFIDVVGNSLRILAKDGTIGYEKTGKFVKYYSLKK